MARRLVWFSCGASSAVLAKMVLERYGTADVRIINCDTLPSEHPSNRKFFDDIQCWLGVPISQIRSARWKTIDEVFMAERFLRGPHGAPCTRALKWVPRQGFQRPDDIHYFGMTADEGKRIREFSERSKGLQLEWLLRDHGVTKSDCFAILTKAGIQLPVMYLQGYRNNNCIGCVKGGAGYWCKIRRDYPDVFKRRAMQERVLNHAILRVKKRPCFLDELPEGVGRYKTLTVQCALV